MIQRVLHLIRERQVRAHRILTCTFSREAARVIEHRLALHPETKGVSVLTLHALAFRVIQEAIRMGFTDVRTGEDGFSRKIFEQARRELIEEHPEDRSAYFNIRFDDFKTYISIQKGNLAMYDVPEDLPQWGADLISAPDEGVDLYAALYRRHDKLRRADKVVDFDDTIVEACLLLMRFPPLLEVMQGKFDYIHVDEFQDVNHAQNEMLNLLAQNSRSYVAIGDDDQTVYQWRGANPKFILGFSERYKASEFRLSTNFRCPMGVISLSEQVIGHNQVRAAKRMKASRGGNGVFIHSENRQRPGTAAYVAMQAVNDGRSPRDVVILVRTYAQTGEIERVFIEEDIPYVVVGGVPFYERHEVRVLLTYLRLAMADLDAQRGIPVAIERRRELMKDWLSVANVPNRYLRKDLATDLARGVWQQGITLAAALEAAASSQHGSTERQLSLLAKALNDLTDDLALSEGKDALLQFSDTIGYGDHLVHTAPTREFGEERSGSIRALAQMAASRSLGELLTYITGLMKQGRFVDRFSATEQDETPRITLMTAFRAKGLEWPVVIVPGCNEGLYRIKPMADVAAAEEERRVFYVAMTRAQEELHLVIEPDQETKFLLEAKYDQVVYGHTRLAQLMGRDPAQWSGRDTLEAAGLLQRYAHEHFVQLWLDSQYRGRLLQRIQSLQISLLDRLHRRDDVRSTLSLQGYEAQGPLTLANDDLLREFADLEQLARELNAQFAGRDRKGHASQRTGMAVRPDEVRKGMKVGHRKLGTGTVLAVKGEGDKVEAEIQFPERERPYKLVVLYANLLHVEELRDDSLPVISRSVAPPSPPPMGGYWAAQPAVPGGSRSDPPKNLYGEDDPLPF